MRSSQLALGLALASLSCGGGTSRHPRPTILTAETPPPPAPAPEPNEERLQPVELHPGASDPIETPPGNTLGPMARRALDGAQTDILGCYSGILPESPDADGSIELQIDLNDTGHVVRLTVDHLAQGGLEHAIPCIRRVVEGLNVREVAAHGHYVSRVYTFHNPPIERTGTPSVTVTPARPPPRPRRGRHGASPPPPPASPSPPPSHPGALSPDEIRDTIAQSSMGLSECYRTARGAAGSGRVTLEISGRGQVEHATFDSPVGGLNAHASCFALAAQAIRFRASGTHTRAQEALVFHR